MFQTNPDDPRTEAQQVADYERRKRPPGKERARMSLHVNWDDQVESEMLYCESLRMLPRGMCRKVVIKFLDLLLGECKDKAEAVRILNAWTMARDKQAIEAIIRGAPEAWRTGKARSNRQQAAAQQRPLQKDFLRRMRDLMQQTEALMASQPEATWESIEADDAPPVPTKQPRSYPEPVETPPPGRAPTQGSWLDSF